MSKWKALSAQRKDQLNFGALMLVAKEARAKGHLNFEIGEPPCPVPVTFNIDVDETVTGTVTLSPSESSSQLVQVTIDFGNVYIRSHLYRVGGMFEPWRHYDICSTGGIPDALVVLATSPPTMRQVFA